MGYPPTSKPFRRAEFEYQTSGNRAIDVSDEFEDNGEVVDERKVKEYAKLWKGTSLKRVEQRPQTYAETVLETLPLEKKEVQPAPPQSWASQGSIAKRWGYF